MFGRGRTHQPPLIPAKAGTQAFFVAEPRSAGSWKRGPRNTKNLGPRLRGDERVWGIAALLFLTPVAALAHPGHPGHEVLGLVDGFIHPFTGADHMLAMAAVGLWAALRGGKAMWAWPSAFVAALLAGFALGRAGVVLPMAAPTILASIIVLGALTAADARTPTALGVTLIAVFGLAHGYAHGVESPHAGAGFPIGMALSSAVLHGVGLAAAFGLQRLKRPTFVRLLGLGAATGGVILAVTA
jgi:urease accessory protein